VVKLLLDSGANVNSCDRWGKSPLDDALALNKERFNPRVVDLLRVIPSYYLLYLHFYITDNALVAI